MLQFHEFVSQFGRNYVGAEYEQRAAVYAKNIADIEAQNAAYAAGESTWFAEVNQFADMHESEMASYKGYTRLPGNRMRSNANLFTTPVDTASLPDFVDWREKGVVTPVKDQAACGSCWAHSAAETLESHAAIQLGIAPPVLSPQQMVDCMQNPDQCGGSGGCEGATADLGFNFSYTGLGAASDYAYTAKDGKCKAVDAVVYAGDYVVLPENDENALMNAIANVGPVSISVAASSWSFYAGGVFDGASGKGCDVVIDHAVQLVGYGVDDATKSAYWLVRNSWSSTWGEEGYIRVARFPGAETCKLDKSPLDGSCGKSGSCVCGSEVAYCGTCGILSDSSYPINLSTKPFQ